MRYYNHIYILYVIIMFKNIYKIIIIVNQTWIILNKNLNWNIYRVIILWVAHLPTKCLSVLYVNWDKIFLTKKIWNVCWPGCEYLLESQSRWHVLCSIETTYNKMVVRKQKIQKRMEKKVRTFSESRRKLYFSFVCKRKFAFEKILCELKFGPFPCREEYREFGNRWRGTSDIIHIVTVLSCSWIVFSEKY